MLDSKQMQPKEQAGADEGSAVPAAQAKTFLFNKNQKRKPLQKRRYDDKELYGNRKNKETVGMLSHKNLIEQSRNCFKSMTLDNEETV